jgi:hypothetical protein
MSSYTGIRYDTATVGKLNIRLITSACNPSLSASTPGFQDSASQAVAPNSVNRLIKLNVDLRNHLLLNHAAEQLVAINGLDNNY